MPKCRIQHGYVADVVHVLIQHGMLRDVVFNMAMLLPHTNVENVETEVGMWDTEK